MAESIARRVHELLNQAMDVEKGQRSEFLRQACQESPELASRVEQLVSAVDDSLPFLEIPALQVFAKEIANGEEPLPQFVGNYEIVKKIGTGGMGSVYEALQQQPRRTVALKIPRKRRWKQDLRQQLRFESELLGRLRHAHIAQVYEAGVDDSQAENPIPFFAMEFVPAARNIRQYVKDQQLDVGDILLLMRRICDAIQHAHRLGIIHRDLKPANILVDSDGNPKVIDFGVASSHAVLEPTFTHASEHDSDTPSRSSSGGEDVSTPIAGTLNYMSPEQCDATCTVDARADVYSLGVILFELLCQSLPYDLKGMSIAEALQTIPTVTLRPALRHGRPLPGDLRAILNRVLEKDRNGRYSSAEALSEDIQRYLESRPVLARKANLLYTGRLAISRNRWLASILGLLVFAILTGLFFSTLFAWRASAEVERRRLAEAQALQQLDQALWQSYVANMLGAYAAFQNREIAMVRSRLSAAPEKHRDWEWDFLSGMVDINEQVIDAHDVMITSFAASDDRSLWATGSQDGIVRVWNSQDGSMVCEIVHNNKSRIRPDSRPPVVTALAFRNGSSQIVSGTGDGAIRIWDALTGRLIRQLTGHPTAIATVSVHPDGGIASTCALNRAKLWDGESSRSIGEINDEQKEICGVQFCDHGRLLVTWGPLGDIWLRDGDSREPLQRLQFSGNPRRVQASQDGSWIAAGGQENRVQLWRTGSDEPMSRSIDIPGNRSSIDSFCFSPDNKELAMGRIDRQIFQYALDDLSRTAQLQGHEEYVRGLCYDPSGLRLMSASGDGTIRIWNLEFSSLGNTKMIKDVERHIVTLALSLDGRNIATAHTDRTIRIYDRNLNQIRQLPNRHLGHIQAIAWSPDGSTIASAGIDRNVIVWNTETGQSTSFTPAHLGALHRLAFSPDGKRLVSAGADRVLRVWDMESQTREFELIGHSAAVISLRFSNDCKWLASGGVDGSVILWDWTTRTMVHQLDGHLSHVFALAFDPTGQSLYTGSRDRTIRVWSTANGQQLNVLSGHGQLIRSLDIHPGGSRLVAGSWFGDILIWDLNRHDLVTSFKGHADIVFELQFSPDGNYFVTCSLDKTMRKFERTVAELDVGE